MFGLIWRGLSQLLLELIDDSVLLSQMLLVLLLLCRKLSHQPSVLRLLQLDCEAHQIGVIMVCTSIFSFLVNSESSADV